MTRHTRREFLAVAGGAGATALVVAFRPWRVLVETASAAAPPERLAGLFRDPESARRIGRAYLRQTPGEAKTGLLAGLVTADLPGGVTGISGLSEAELRERLSRQMVDDFAQGRTATVQGWVLSLTEARLCALTTLV